MSCWVVAALAAEVLQIPVNQVLERVRSGTLSSKTDLGFLLVDIAPNSPGVERTPRSRRPPTFRPINSPPVSAAPAQLALEPASTPEINLSEEEELALSADPDPHPAGPSKFELTDWRRSRQATSRSRLRPPTYRAA